MFALIKWVEDGKLSILPSEHIRDFDEDEYFAGMDEKDVYLVEWHQGVKEPKGGWPVYEASIIKIAGAFIIIIIISSKIIFLYSRLLCLITLALVDLTRLVKYSCFS